MILVKYNPFVRRDEIMSPIMANLVTVPMADLETIVFFRYHKWSERSDQVLIKGKIIWLFKCSFFLNVNKAIELMFTCINIFWVRIILARAFRL